MILLLKLIAITTIWVLGLKIATSENMVLEKVGQYGKAKVEEGKKIFEAIIVCQWCMPSIHSLVGYGFAFGLGILPLQWNWQLLIRYPLVVMGASFCSGMLWLLYETINRIHDRNEVELKYLKHCEQLKHWEVKGRQEIYHENKKQRSR